MTFKEKERLIRYIFKKRQQILMYSQHVCDKADNEECAQDLFLSWVHYALCSCSKVSRFILENEFILYKRKEWWYDYFSRSSYYRMKQKAMDEFLDCLHN